MGKRLFSLTAFIASIMLAVGLPIQTNAETVQVETPGTLQEIVSALANEFITSLTVSGKLNGADIYYLQQLPGNVSNLETLDISQIELIPGEECYGSTRKSVSYKENIVTCYFFISEDNRTEYGQSFTDMLGTTRSAWKVYCNDLQYAFQSSKLKRIVFPNVLTSLGEGICNGSAIEEAVAGPNTVSVGSDAFYPYGTTGKLRSFTGGKIENLGDGSFRNQGKLSNIDLSHAKTIGESAFSGCKSIIDVSIPKVNYIPNGAFRDCPITSLKLSDELTYIGGYAFNECTMSKLVLPSKVQSIGSCAFSKIPFCNVTFPTGLKYICGDSFGRWGMTSTYKVEFENGVYYINDIAVCPDGIQTDIEFKRGTRLIAPYFLSTYPNSIKFNDDLKEIGEYAFYDGRTNYGKNIKHINLPNSLVSIGRSAFYGFDTIESIVIPKNVEKIGDDCFSACDNLKSVEIRSSKCKIGDNAFRSAKLRKIIYTGDYRSDESIPTDTLGKTIGSSRLIRLEIAPNIAVIDHQSLIVNQANAYPDLRDLYIFNPTPPETSDFWTYVTIHVPAGSRDKYLNHEKWSNAKEIVEFDPLNVERPMTQRAVNVNVNQPGTLQSTVESLNVDDIRELTVTGPINGTDIGYLGSAPYNISALEMLDISEVELVADDTYYGQGRDGSDVASGVYNLYFSDEYRVEYKSSSGGLGHYNTYYDIHCNDLRYAFAKSKLKKVKFPKTVTTLGDGIFEYSDIEEFVAGPNVRRVDYKAFSGSELKTFSGGRVEYIGEKAFSCSNLKSFDFSHVIEIGKNAFMSLSFTDVTLPKSLQSISRLSFSTSNDMVYENGVYYVNDIAVVPEANVTEIHFKKNTRFIAHDFNANKVTKVWFNEEIDSIGREAFTGAPIEQVKLHAVRKISDKAFCDCKNLTTVTTEMNILESIGNKAFYGCTNLQSFPFRGNQISHIGESAFNSCSKLNDIDLTNTDYVGENAFYYGGTITAYPVCAYEIGECAFQYATNTCETLTLGKNLKKLGERSFSNLQGVALKNIIIESEELENNDFSSRYWSAIFSNSIDELETLQISSNVNLVPYLGLISDNDSNITSSDAIVNPITVRFTNDSPENTPTELILDRTFRDCKRLHTVKIPAYVTVGKETFYNSTIVEALYDSTAVASNSLSEKEIGEYAFYNASKLEKIELDPNVSKICNDNFKNCHKLRDVTSFRSTPPEYAEGFSTETYQYGTLYVPGESKEIYRTTAPWRNFKNIVEIGLGSRFKDGDLWYEITNNNAKDRTVKVISSIDGENAASDLENYPGLDEADIPNFVSHNGLQYTVNEIGSAAFMNTSIDYVYMSDSVKNIGDYAFANCQALELINDMSIPENVTSIGAHAFEGDSILFIMFSPEYPSKLEYIRDYAFHNGPIVSIEGALPTNLKSIGAYCFGDCEINFEGSEFEFPGKLTEIGDSAFVYASIYGSKGAALKIHGNLAFGSGAFHGAIFNKLVLEEGVETLGDVFSGNTHLKSVEIPSSLRSIGQNAFIGCPNIREIKVGRQVPPTSTATANEIFEEEVLSSAYLSVPGGCTYSYKNTEPWSSFGAVIDCEMVFNVNGLWFEVTDAEAKTVKVTYTPGKTMSSWGMTETAYDNLDKSYIIIPETVSNGERTYKVTEIGDYAFANVFKRGKEMTVYFDGEITRIGNRAFYGCSGLEELNIGGNSYGSIAVGDYAFYLCANLKSSTGNFFKYLKSIGKYAFHGCDSITMVDLTECEEIDSYAFFSCLSLYSVRLNGSVQISNFAFYYCRALTYVLVDPDNYTTYNGEGVSDNSFYGIDKDNAYVITTANKFSDSPWCGFKNTFYSAWSYIEADNINVMYLMQDDKKTAMVNRKDYHIPPAEPTDNYNFSDGRLVIEPTLTIGDYTYEINRVMADAFIEVANISYVSLPSTMKYIDRNAFEFAEVDGGVLDVNCYNPPQLHGFKDWTYQNVTLRVPAGAKSKYASTAPWSNFVNIEETDAVVVGSRFKEGDLWYEVTGVGLTDNTVKVISSIIDQSPELNTSYTELEGRDIIVPQTISHAGVDYTVTELGEYAFHQTKLASLTVPPTITKFGEASIVDFSNNLILNISDLSAFCRASAYGFFLAYVKDIRVNGESLPEDFTIPADVEVVGDGIFNYCKQIKKLTIPATVKRVGTGAFFYTINLESVTIADSQEPLDLQSRFGMGNRQGVLKEVYINRPIEGVDNIFRDCISLTSVTLGGNVDKIPAGMFWDCNRVRNLEWTDNITEIGDYAFYDCGELYIYSLPANLEYIGDDAFGGHGVIPSLPDGLRHIGSSAFSGFRLGFTEFPQALTYVGSDAFRNSIIDNGEWKLKIHPGMTIGYNAFAYCENLSCLEFEEGWEELTSGTFVNNNYLSQIIFPSTIKHIDAGSFAGCQYITTVVSKSITPAASSRLYGYGSIFDDMVYSDATLLVPPGCKNNYTNIDYNDSRYHWTRFRHVEENELAGVGDVSVDDEGVTVKVVDGRIVIEGCADDATVEIYDTAGRLVYAGGDDLPELVAGFYVVRVGSTKVKIKI